MFRDFITKINKTLMYEFWYDYVKSKYEIITDIVADDIYKDIAEDAKTRFDTSNYELERPLLKGENKKVIGLMNNK